MELLPLIFTPPCTAIVELYNYISKGFKNTNPKNTNQVSPKFHIIRRSIYNSLTIFIQIFYEGNWMQMFGLMIVAIVNHYFRMTGFFITQLPEAFWAERKLVPL